MFVLHLDTFIPSVIRYCEYIQIQDVLKFDIYVWHDQKLEMHICILSDQSDKGRFLGERIGNSKWEVFKDGEFINTV